MRYHLTFSIPTQRQGDRQPYQAFNATIEALTKIQGKETKGATVRSVEVTSGSVKGQCNIDAPNFEGALELCCSRTPILDLEWHIEEVVDSAAVQRILTSAMRQ